MKLEFYICDKSLADLISGESDTQGTVDHVDGNLVIEINGEAGTTNDLVGKKISTSKGVAHWASVDWSKYKSHENYEHGTKLARIIKKLQQIGCEVSDA